MKSRAIEPRAMVRGGGANDGSGVEESPSRRARRAAAQELARESGVVRVRGASMVPTLAPTCWVRFAPRRPRVGDVVVYRRAEEDLVVHRFLGRRPTWWDRDADRRGTDPWIVTKPDAAAEFDVEARASAVLGTVDAFRPDPSASWQRLDVTWTRRVASALWFGRYVLRRALRRLAR